VHRVAWNQRVAAVDVSRLPRSGCLAIFACVAIKLGASRCCGVHPERFLGRASGLPLVRSSDKPSSGPRLLSVAGVRRDNPNRMAPRLHQYRKWLAFAALAIGSAGFCLLCGQWQPRPASQADDGWRRTERGWERAVAWNRPAIASTNLPADHATPSLPAKSAHRWDAHPAALALVQLAAVLLAFFALPVGCRLRAPSFPTLFTRLPTLVAKSFRASAFG